MGGGCTTGARGLLGNESPIGLLAPFRWARHPYLKFVCVSFDLSNGDLGRSSLIAELVV
jgi:hypothetical protein